MRRRPGIAGLQNAAATRVCAVASVRHLENILWFCPIGRLSCMEFQDQFRVVGENVAKVRTDVMKEQLTTFRSQLEEFARKHKVVCCYRVLVECGEYFVENKVSLD
jgi:ESCRT-II complex subunit VPS22